MRASGDEISRDPLGDIASLPVMTGGPAASDSEEDVATADEFLDAWTGINRNLYAGFGNDPVHSVDFLGLQASLCNPAGAAIVAEAEAAAAGFPSLAAQQAAAARAAAAAAAAAATLSGDRAETRAHGQGERGRERKNPNPDKAQVDKAAGRDRGTGKLDRPPQPKPEAPRPEDPLRGKFPKRPPEDIMPPKDGCPAPVRGGR